MRKLFGWALRKGGIKMAEKKKETEYDPGVEAEAFVNVFYDAEEMFRLVFAPPVFGFPNASNYQELVQSYCLRLSLLMQSMLKLDQTLDKGLLICGMRTIYELALDVEMICHGEELYGPDYQTIIRDKHNVVAKLQLIKAFKNMTAHEDKKVQAAGSRGLRRRNAEVMEEKERVFPEGDSEETGEIKLNHWTGKPIVYQAIDIDKILKQGKFFERSYKDQYSIACEFVHGGVSPLNLEPDIVQIKNLMGQMCPWIAEVLAEHVMIPVWKFFGFDKKYPEEFSSIVDWEDAFAQSFSKKLHDSKNPTLNSTTF